MSNDLSTLDTVTGEMQTLVNGYVKVILFKVQLPGPGTLYKEDGIFRNNVPGVNRIGFPGSIASCRMGGRKCAERFFREVQPDPRFLP